MIIWVSSPSRLIWPPAVAGRVLWNRVCTSFHLPFHLFGHFLGIGSLVFVKFWHGATNLFEIVHGRVWFSRKKFFGQKITKFFLNSIMKVCIVCCVPRQIPYYPKFLFVRYGPKCSQPIKLQDFLINYISRTKVFLCYTMWVALAKSRRRGKHLTSQLPWLAAWLLVTIGSPVYLVVAEFSTCFLWPLTIGQS